ncbi:N-acetylneuraminate synthase [Algimonas arctica]|uniref:N-acetylneuraminate synthase n=1 Tax=Algimonas arctica TaxID=1479486 RepID=A0A8J3G135_9PROT|nr:N-acetylneuraminate synthase family protein [Algimonas arctica]GHA85078.1 N-acetylneuraminate synthase [Algimonas arctica]
MVDNNLINAAVQANRCFIIAEIGVNHNGDIATAKAMIDAAAETGVDAVKFQIYRTEELVTPHANKAAYQLATTGAKDAQQWSMLKALELTNEQHRTLRNYCSEIGVPYICTPYDIASARFLAEELEVAAIKVASSDATNIPFLRNLDDLDCPVILSTGMCSIDEVRAAVAALAKTNDRGELYVLQCTSNYPAPAEEANLRVMSRMFIEFGCPVGFSDHTVGSEVAILAVAHGAQIIEKHFTLDRSMIGPDHLASSEPSEFADLVASLRRVELILGSPDKTVTDAERENKSLMQKGVYFRHAKTAGEIIAIEDVAFKRPAATLSPADADKIVGKALAYDVAKNQAVEWMCFTTVKQ